MSYANFKPVIWSKYIEHELAKILTFKEDCDFRFEGEVGKGKRVKILGVGRPTIGDYDGSEINPPEKIADSSVYLDIDQHKYFNFMVDDVDKAQAKEGLMPALMEETTRTLKEEVDSFCAKEIGKNCGGKSASLNITGASDPEKAMAEAVDNAFIYLWDNGVQLSDKVTIYLTPKFYTIFKRKLVELKTDNDKLIAKGIVGYYNNAKVKITNNIYNDKTDDYLIIKSSKAYAFCDGINDTEAYRPEKLFSDAVKGLHTYGGKMVRPKEAYVIKAH